MSQKWQAVRGTASDLTGLAIEPQTSRTGSDVSNHCTLTGRLIQNISSLFLQYAARISDTKAPVRILSTAVSVLLFLKRCNAQIITNNRKAYAAHFSHLEFFRCLVGQPET